MNRNQVGVIGLAVMGKNLALNIANHGYTVSVYNRSRNKTDELLKEPDAKNISGTYSIEEFVQSLSQPRRIIMMVKAGDAVDETIGLLKPHLSKGDVLVDGGNSYYVDTMRRSTELEREGLHFIGAGVSGGEEGARNGPAIMPGGEREAYGHVESVFTDISAKVEGEPCCTYVGKDGAGHFVKMLHNGIEYADMQLISEAYFILKKVLALSTPQIQEIFEEWRRGELSSYLIDITADILKKKDPESGEYLVDKVLDVAEQKGTGKWTSQVALDMGVPIPTITEAVFMRYLSAMKEERVVASGILKGPAIKVARSMEFVESIRKALYASKICAYAQGFGMMRSASLQYQWDLNLGSLAMIFRGGCIIRAQFLNRIKEAYDKEQTLPNLLLDEYFQTVIGDYQAEWRDVISSAMMSGVPVPGFASSLSYYDSYRAGVLPMNVLQAQRDYFGAHTYRRTDRPGVFHTQW